MPSPPVVGYKSDVTVAAECSAVVLGAVLLYNVASRQRYLRSESGRQLQLTATVLGPHSSRVETLADQPWDCDFGRARRSGLRKFALDC